MREETLWFKADKMYAEVLPKAGGPLNNVVSEDVFQLVYLLRSAHPEMSQMLHTKSSEEIIEHFIITDMSHTRSGSRVDNSVGSCVPLS